MTGLIIVAVFVALLCLGVPIAVAVAMAGICALLVIDVSPVLLAHHMVGTLNSFTLLAVPGFLLVGTLMSRSGLVDRLINFSIALVGWVSGGLSIVTVFASMVFAGISGSAAADAAAVGSATIPALKKDEYDHEFAAALVAAGSSIGIIIPPSIPMIIYGVSTNTSIPKLFVGGYGPGILLGVAFMILLFIVARLRGYGSKSAFLWRRLVRTFLQAFWALLAPVLIVGGIVLGIMTPTESAVVGVFYTLAVGCLIYRTLTFSAIRDAILEAVVLTGVVMFVVAMSGLLAWVMAREGIPQQLVSFVTSHVEGRIAIILGINLLLLLLGAVMDTIAIMLIVLPVLTPIGLALGFDPIHFGVMLVFNLAIGLLTPPLGYCLFVSASIAGVSIGRVSVAIMPFVVVSIMVLLVVAFWPPLTLSALSILD